MLNVVWVVTARGNGRKGLFRMAVIGVLKIEKQSSYSLRRQKFLSVKATIK